jgi:hypothetical protein
MSDDATPNCHDPLTVESSVVADFAQTLEKSEVVLSVV